MKRSEQDASAAPKAMEGQNLREPADAALRHWQERSECLLAEASGEDYNSVPLPPTFTARLTYRHIGPLKPLPYSLDE